MTDPDRESWIVEQLSNLPDKADAALILRHAEREEIPQGTFGVDVPLTTSGVTSAERLGATLSGIRPLVYASASPGAEVRIDGDGDSSRRWPARRGCAGLETRGPRPVCCG